MKKLVLVIGFIVSCFLPIFASGPASAQAEATHDRAAGSITYYKRHSGQLRIIDFDVHDPYLHHSSNGTMTYTIKKESTGDTLLILEFDVRYVNIHDNVAKFVAYCTDASNPGPKVGDYFSVVIYDMATPGASGDMVRHRWWGKNLRDAIASITDTGSTRGLEPPSGLLVEGGDARILLAE